MRCLITLALCVVAFLPGCSKEPDLTPEQKVGLQMLGELQKTDPDVERYSNAKKAMRARAAAYSEAIGAGEPDKRREAMATELRMAQAENHLIEEYNRLKALEEGSKAATDWYINETKKTDEQLMDEWEEYSPAKP